MNDQMIFPTTSDCAKMGALVGLSVAVTIGAFYAVLKYPLWGALGVTAFLCGACFNKMDGRG